MRNFTLGALLLLTCVAAIATVYQKPASPASTKTPADSEPTVAAPVANVPCEKCQAGVVDVTDLNAAYSASPAIGTPVSFEEPPYAKPRDVQPVQFEQPGTEAAPAPRLVK